MSFRGSGGHLFVYAAFHKQCAVNHLRWRVSAPQRIKHRGRTPLHFALAFQSNSLLPCWDAVADVWFYCVAPAVPVQRLLSNHFRTLSQNSGRGVGGEGAPVCGSKVENWKWGCCDSSSWINIWTDWTKIQSRPSANLLLFKIQGEKK